MTRVIAASLAVLALAAGCGGDGGEGAADARDRLARTAAKLGEIRSGVLDLRLVLDPKGNDTERVGFEVHGPFALDEGGAARFSVDYTQIHGEREATVKLISTGKQAYVTVGGTSYELPPGQAAELRDAGGAVGGDDGLGQLELDDWIQDPRLSDGDDVGGDETDRISARLDVAAAAEDLLALARDAGAGDVGELSQEELKRLRDAVDEATIEVLSGSDDDLLRRLDIDASLGLDVPDELADLVGEVVGAKLDVELTIEHPNEPVAVTAPTDARPPSEFPGG
ncbi:MAG: hypothetical protein ABR583_10715 [Gaiellaceae bacterium]